MLRFCLRPFVRHRVAFEGPCSTGGVWRGTSCIVGPRNSAKPVLSLDGESWPGNHGGSNQGALFMTQRFRLFAAHIVILLAAVFLVGWMAETVFAQSSRSRDSRSSRDRSTRASDRDDDFDDDDDDDDDFEAEDRSDSRRSRSRSSRSSSSSSSSSRRSSSSSRRGSSDYEPPAIVFGASYERVGVRPRGNIHSLDAFEALPCVVTTGEAAGTTFYRCDGKWYNRINHEGWICYSEVFPPAGLSVAALPSGAVPTQTGGRTLYATEDAFYQAVRVGGNTGYVVVEPEIGWEFERLPSFAVRGIPVRSGRNDYYRHLGVFYRQEKTGATSRYVVAPSPFSGIPLPLVAAVAPAS
jgi:hypothetical protein